MKTTKRRNNKILWIIWAWLMAGCGTIISVEPDADVTPIADAAVDAMVDALAAQCGTMLAYISDSNRLVVMDDSGSQEIASQMLTGVDWSPVAYTLTYTSNADGRADAYILPVQDGAVPARITDDEFLETFPAWSPGGTMLALRSNKSGTVEMHIYDTRMMDGGQQVTFFGDGNVGVPTWLTGDSLVFDRYNAAAGQSDIYEVKISTKEVRNLTASFDYDASSPAVTADGAVAFSVGGTVAPGIYTLEPASGEIRRITDGGLSPVWSPDMLEIAYVYRGDLYRVNAWDANPTPAQVAASGIEKPDWGPDNRIAFRRSNDKMIYIIDEAGMEKAVGSGKNPKWSSGTVVGCQ